MRDSLVAEATSIELRVDQALHRDETLIPDNYAGPELVVVAHSNRIASLTPHGRIVRPLSARSATAMLDAATLARDERCNLGVDTALSRVITTLYLRVDHARGPSHSFSFTGAVNHSAPHALPGLWSTLLRVMRDAIGPLDAANAAAWDLALTWTGAFDLGPTFRHGGVVALPHLVTAFNLDDGGVYLRTGQLPVAGDPYRTMDRTPSVLYRFEEQPALLVDENARRAIAPDPEDDRRWTLPCGGGAIALHHEWKAPPRLVVRVDDPGRGIYVQKI